MKSQNKNQSEVVRVGLLGLGNVGAGVAEILATHGEMIEARAGVPIRISRALVRNKRRKRPGAAGDVTLTTKATDIVGADDIETNRADGWHRACINPCHGRSCCGADGGNCE